MVHIYSNTPPLIAKWLYNLKENLICYYLAPCLWLCTSEPLSDLPVTHWQNSPHQGYPFKYRVFSKFENKSWNQGFFNSNIQGLKIKFPEKLLADWPLTSLNTPEISYNVCVERSDWLLWWRDWRERVLLFLCLQWQNNMIWGNTLNLTQGQYQYNP